MMRIAWFAAFLLLPSVAATAASKVGGVSRAEGACHATLNGRSERLAVASAVYLDQELRTAAKARLEITFLDESKLTLGENAQIMVDRFVYNPGKRNRLLLSVTGAMRFVGNPDTPHDSDTVISTPHADVGVRGTDFWAGPIDGQYSFLLLEGEIVVTTPAGEAVLDEPGEGVNIAAPGAAPGPVTRWPQAKVARALAQVAFP